MEKIKVADYERIVSSDSSEANCGNCDLFDRGSCLVDYAICANASDFDCSPIKRINRSPLYVYFKIKI